MIYYLKFPTEATFLDACEQAGLVTEEGIRTSGHDIALDVIGTVYKPTGKTLTVDGQPTPEMAPVDGYHANLMVMGEFDMSAFEAFVIDAPNSPARVFA